MESGILEPDEATLQVKADFSSEAFSRFYALRKVGILGKVSPLQRKLWLAGYYAAIMEFIEPHALFENPRLEPSVKVSSYGVEKAYALGYSDGCDKAASFGFGLFGAIAQQLIKDDEAEAVRKRSAPAKK